MTQMKKARLTPQALLWSRALMGTRTPIFWLVTISTIAKCAKTTLIARKRWKSTKCPRLWSSSSSVSLRNRVAREVRAVVASLTLHTPRSLAKRRSTIRWATQLKVWICAPTRLRLKISQSQFCTICTAFRTISVAWTAVTTLRSWRTSATTSGTIWMTAHARRCPALNKSWLQVLLTCSSIAWETDAF